MEPDEINVLSGLALVSRTRLLFLNLIPTLHVTLNAAPGANRREVTRFLVLIVRVFLLVSADAGDTRISASLALIPAFLG